MRQAGNILLFQSTLPWREWLSNVSSGSHLLKFQSTLPWREWPVVFMQIPVLGTISIHTPVKGVTLHLLSLICTIHTFQSTLPWREWPGSCSSSASAVIISIHTPVKGVTSPNRDKAFRLWQISIHTPVKGVTAALRWGRVWFGDFNPHSREGSDIGQNIKNQRKKAFQSTLPWREWHQCFNFIHIFHILFQSTLPWREWLKKWWYC